MLSPPPMLGRFPKRYRKWVCWLALVKTAKEVLEFIGVEPDLARLQCLEKNQNRTFKREQKNSETNFKKYFSVSQKFLIAKHVKMLNATLVKNDQKWLPASYLDFSKFGHNIQFKFQTNKLLHWNLFSIKLFWCLLITHLSHVVSRRLKEQSMSVRRWG